MRTGERAVFGATTIVNHAATPATLIAGRLVGEVAPGNAVVTDVRVIDLGPAPGSGDLLGAGRWPDRSWRQWWQRAVPIADARLAAHHAAELVFVVEMRREGDWVWPRTAVDYEVAGSRHTATTDFGFQLCPPEPAPCSELTKDDG